MAKDVNKILKEVLTKIDPSKEETKFILESLNHFLERLETKRKKMKIEAEVFVGGSYAKETLIKKDKYDVDVFLRFDKRYKEEEISKLAKKMISGSKFSTIHGSRDYFEIKVSPLLVIELIPVMKVKKTSEAENITDLSYSHVKYIRKKIKDKKILDEIKLAKAFCYGNNCYGAESYIKGFSGYSLELLVYHYKTFIKFLKEMVKVKQKTVIDIEKQFKNKQETLLNLNSSKLASPVILIDPTYKQRNALAGLSEETFLKFQKSAKEFLKNPDIRFFEEEVLNIQKIKEKANKNKNDFALIEIETSKQEGDIAGSKLLKFHNHLLEEIGKLFDIKDKGFEYPGNKKARIFFVAKKKKEVICNGPFVSDKENVSKFKKEHKKTFIKKGRIYAKEQVKENLKDFLGKWKVKNSARIKEMYITDIKIIG